MWCPEHNAGNAYSCFVINDKCIDLISYFDETFYPAYYEDCDYARRMLLKGREITKIPNCQYIHVGSRTLNNFSDIEKQYHNETFKANEAYFVRKWGGMPTQEIYSTPFGV
jgi:GT2 family glycosyltransferase